MLKMDKDLQAKIDHVTQLTNTTLEQLKNLKDLKDQKELIITNTTYKLCLMLVEFMEGTLKLKAAEKDVQENKDYTDALHTCSCVMADLKRKLLEFESVIRT